MASSAIAVPAQVNGNGNGSTAAIPPSRSLSPMSISSSTKRKRDDGSHDSADTGSQAAGSPGADIEPVAAVKGATQKPRDQKLLVREYFHVLQRHDFDVGVLKRPLSDASAEEAEPESKKRRKSDGESVAAHQDSIEEKVLQDGYATLEDILVDVTRTAEASISALKSTAQQADDRKTGNLIAKIMELKHKAHSLYRRELAYPSTEHLQSSGLKPGNGASHLADGRALLMTYASVNNGKKPLLTSLQKPISGTVASDKTPREITGAGLPTGIMVTHALREELIPTKVTRSRTLGELFPSPRNLPPLQPPKPNKSTTKSNVLGFYHPVLTDQSSYRSGTYFTQNVSMGQWLDYSNATPATHKKTKQRERAQSLAGVKPSSTELEMSEMEALFRGAFSSFAPCKDDTAAVVPAGQMSRIHWQKYGRRNLQRVIESDAQVDETESAETTASDALVKNNLPDVEEDVIKEVMDTWDDAAIDPSLADIMGEKSKEDKETEDILQEVSDLIETLASYQRNRNLTLPTSQDRFSADPPNGDMLRNGALSHQPSEEEMLTYQALKAQLALIIQTLPPFAVARINSDKLEELSVSTKIEIRTDDFRGVMDEDERALRSRQAQAQAAAPPSRGTPHRTPSMSGSVPYQGHHQYGGQYGGPARSPMPAPYPQTPARAQQPIPYQRPPSAVALPPQHQQVRHPQPQPQPYRTPNGYGAMAPQIPKQQVPYSHYNGGSANPQPRMQPQQVFANGPQAASPNHRYQQPFPGGYPPQQHQPHSGQQPMQPPQHPGMPQQRSYPAYINGNAAQMPPRTMSPQVGGGQPHAYSQSPTPPQQHQQPSRSAPYGTPNQGMPPGVRSFNGGPQAMSPQAHNRGVPGGIPGYASGATDAHQKQVLEQARQQAHSQQQAQAAQQAQARLDAQSRAAATFGQDPSSQGGNKVSGLAGIGLSGNMDIQRMAAMRSASSSMGRGNSMSQSPKGPVSQPVPPAGHSINGGVTFPPPVGPSGPPPGAAASPAVGGTSPAA